MIRNQIVRAAEEYRRDGFCVSPVLLPADLLDATCRGVSAVIDGHYETGVEPYARNWVPSDRDGEVISVAEPHRCDRAIRDAVVQPMLGHWVAGITGTGSVEIIAVDLFCKGPESAGRVHVGWHQDAPFLVGEDDVLTAWLALSDVTIVSAPLMYVRGSHRLGEVTDRTNFFAPDIDVSRVRSLVPDNRGPDIVVVEVPRGAFAFHHRHTLHASGANLSNTPRISLAIRLRANESDELGPQLPGHETIRIHGARPDDCGPGRAQANDLGDGATGSSRGGAKSTGRHRASPL